MKVVLKTGIVSTGELTMANENGIELTSEEKEKINGKKQITIKKVPFAFEQIKTTRLV